jgi:hypothetical protein
MVIAGHWKMASILNQKCQWRVLELVREFATKSPIGKTEQEKGRKRVMDELPVIFPDADPINADWIKVSYWSKVIAGMNGPEEFKEYLVSGKDPEIGPISVESFRSLHYFSYLAERYPWLNDL